MDKIVAIILAGGSGDRLQPLTRERSKASVPFAGKYRLIDLTLSNCVNSGMRKIFVLTQYLSESLNRHVQEGWSISSSGLGDFIYCIPAQMKIGTDWFRGTADAVRQNLNLLEGRDIEDVLILSGDHVYKMDYSQMLYFHRSHKSELTISAIRVRKDQAARRLGVLEVDTESRLIGFEEKPENPKTLPENSEYTLASMGIYIFNVKTLLNALKSDGHDFGKHIIPGMINSNPNMFVYDYEANNKIKDYSIVVKDGVREKVLLERTRDSCCWRDVGTIDSFYEASMDLVRVDPDFSLYGEKWPLRTYQRQLPPTKYILGGKAMDSIISEGCIISGASVEGSVLSPGVIIERDSLVQQAVVFDDVLIEPGARIRRAILDKNCRIHAGATLGFDPEADKTRGFMISDNGIVVVPKGCEITCNDQKLL
jgi:glucose-1-phosphate adenylyltransferase